MIRLAPLFFCAAAAAAWAGELETARQALDDGVWRSALAAADIAATNAGSRTAARLIALEALAHLGDDAEIRRRLAAWTDETAEAFRYWRAREQVRVGDFQQAKVTLAEPFTDQALSLPVACLKACMLAASGDRAGALKLIAAAKPSDKPGMAGEDARLIMGELLGDEGRPKEAVALLRPLAEGAERLETRLRAGYLLGFAEMAEASTRTAGVSRVRTLLRKHPGARVSLPAARVFADRLLELGDAAGAADEYRRYLEVNPSAATEADVLERRGRALFLLGKRSEAAGAFASAEQMATNTASRARAAFLQAAAFLADGRYAEAAAGYARSASYGGEGAPRARFAEADALERAGAMEQAEKAYGALAQEGGPWGAKAQLRLTSILARKGQLAAAIEGYTRLIAETNLLSAADVTEAHLGRGRACYRDYRFKDAAADFEMVAARDPSRADGMRFLRALCHYGAGRDVDAKAEAASLMTSTKDAALRADLMLWCAKYEFNQGEYSDARTHFETYASLRTGTPSAAEALLWAARCASALTEYSKAVELATQAATASAADRALFVEALLVQGEAVMELGRYAEAVQVFDRASAQAGTGPTATKAAVLKADALYAMGAGNLSRYEEAIAAYRALMEGGTLTPDQHIEVAFKIGRALEKLRRTREAMDQYYRHVVLAFAEGVAQERIYGAPACTFFSRAAFSLADYYAASGDFKAAARMLGRVVAADVPAAAEARRRLSGLHEKGGVE